MLGASNITFSLPTVVRAVQRTFDGHARLWAVHGHGRSYGKRSRAVGRELDGILESGFWQAFGDRAVEGPVYALVTDLGNDLIYDVPPAQIIDWADECLQRLSAADSDGHVECTVTKMPAEALLSLSAPRFYTTQKLFFPKQRADWELMKSQIRELDGLIDNLAERHAATLVPTRRHWYFIDPIHLRELRRREAWRLYLGGWPTAPEPDVPLVGPRDRYRIHRLQPAVKWVGPEERRHPQPVLTEDRFEFRQW